MRFWKPLERTRMGRFVEETLLAARAVLHGLRGEKISLRAAALTYITIFSLVPLLAVALALVEMLRAEQFRDLLKGFIHQVLAPGIREESARYLDRYIHSTVVRTAGGVGFILLLFSAGWLLRNLDSSLNEIWNVRKKRSWLVRITAYWVVLVLGPPFMALSLAGTAVLSGWLEREGLPFLTQVYEAGWWLASIASFTLLYLVAPKAHVRFRPALAGGLVAGTAWELARQVYAVYATSVIRLNPFYGALGALPLFLMWVFLSWVLVLFGARLAYAVQHARFRGGVMELGAHPRARELVAARIAQLATLALAGGEPPQDARVLSARMHVPEATVSEILELLCGAGLVRLDAAGGALPAKSPTELTLADVSSAVGGTKAGLHQQVEPAKASEFRDVEPYFARGDDAVLRRLSRVTWASLAPALVPLAGSQPADTTALAKS
jgi:membrane protein